MGQKINAIAFRLNVPHRGQDSLMFRDQTGMQRVKNSSGTKDRVGWSSSFSGNRDEWTYGAYLTLTRSMVTYREERRKQAGGAMNRVHVHASPSQIDVSIEWMPLDIEAYRLSSTKLTEDRAIAMVRAEARFEAKGVLLPRGCYKPKVRMTSHNLYELAMENDGWATDYESIAEKTNLKGKELNQRVKKTALVAAMRTAGLHPVSPRVSRRIAMALEDTSGATKHTDILGDVESILTKCSESMKYGLIGHLELGIDREGRRLPPIVHGGYRGCRLTVKGTIDASRRTHKEVIQLGIVPLSTRSMPMSAWTEASNTKSGSRGVQMIYVY